MMPLKRCVLATKRILCRVRLRILDSGEPGMLGLCQYTHTGRPVNRNFFLAFRGFRLEVN